MSIHKTIRLTGSSDRSFEHAIATVLARAATSTEGITSFEVIRSGGTVDAAGVPSSFEVTLDLTFVVRERTHP